MGSTIGSNYGDVTSLNSACISYYNIAVSQDVVQLTEKLGNLGVLVQGNLVTGDGLDEAVVNRGKLEVINGVQLVSYIVNNQIQSVVTLSPEIEATTEVVPLTSRSSTVFSLLATS